MEKAWGRQCKSIQFTFASYQSRAKTRLATLIALIYHTEMGKMQMKTKKILTFPQSEVCHLAQCPKLQLRTLGTKGAAPRQAASLTLIVNVADISCLQVRSRVWIPSPHVTVHGVHSPRTQLDRRKKNVTQSPDIPFDTQTDEEPPVEGIIKNTKGDEIHTRRQSSYFNIRNTVESTNTSKAPVTDIHRIRNGIQTEGATVRPFQEYWFLYILDTPYRPEGGMLLRSMKTVLTRLDKVWDRIEQSLKVVGPLPCIGDRPRALDLCLWRRRSALVVHLSFATTVH